MNEEYSPYKIVHHPNTIAQMKMKHHITPLQVHLVPTNRCNQNCSFCAYRMHGYSSSQNFGGGDEIEIGKLLDIISSLNVCGVKAVQFTGGGEPTVHKGIDRAFEQVLVNDMDLSLVSNGVNWNDRIIDNLANASWVRVSVDCFSPDTYTKTRNVKVDQYHRMIQNVKSLVMAKSKDMVFGIGFVITKDNWQEVYRSAKFFKELGVDNFRISAAFTDTGISYYDGWFEDAKQETLKTFDDLNDENFTVFNLFNDRIGDLFEGTQDYDFCPMKSLVPYIGADLKVYTCCTLAYNDLGYVGNLREQSFEDMWFSPETKIFMANHNPRKSCRLPCMFEKKNEFINYCIKKDAKHTNFI